MSDDRNVSDECGLPRPVSLEPAWRHAELLTDPEFVWSVLANSAEAIEVLDLEARIQFMSGGALRARHLDDGDALIGTPWLAGWRGDAHAQAAAAIAAAKIGRTSTFESQRDAAQSEPAWWEITVAPIRGSGGYPARLLVLARDVTARRLARQSQQAMRHELHHRVKNTLAMAMAIASQSLARARTIAEGRLAIEQRLMAFAEVHNVLREGDDNGASLHRIVDRASAPYDSTPSRFTLAGDDLTVTSSAALAIAMALHELCTNAVKHGALSARAGRVDIGWRVEPATRRFRLDWREHGGPAVRGPIRPGFGMRVIEASFRDQLGGRVDISPDPSGLRCSIEVPLSALCTTSDVAK